MKNKILILGANGMAGHIISLYLSEIGYDVETVTRKPFLLNVIKNYIWTGDFNDLRRKITDGDFKAVINCIGILGDKCTLSTDETILYNSYLPHFLVKTTANIYTKIIHLSTDCVFSGEKGNYLEKDLPDGKTLYDRSKALGEFNNKKDVVLRNSIIGPDMNLNGVGLFNWFLNQKTEINGFDNWLWSGITTLELAKKINFVIKENLTGLFHLTNNVKISKFNLLSLIKVAFDMQIKINKKYLPETIDKSLINTRNNKFLQIPTYAIMIQELYTWINEHGNIYQYEV